MNVKVLAVCSLFVLSACTMQKKGPVETVDLGVNGQKQQIEITGGIYDDNAPRMPIVSNDPDVTVFPLDGPVQSPLSIDRHNGVLENTTAGGYTVFDDSVKVYPLPGEDVPAFVPQYAVPPLKNQYVAGTGLVGERLTSLAESTLPPVPTVDVGPADPFANPPVSGAVRQPLMLTAPERVGLQAPSEARAPMLSPFADEKGPAPAAEASTDSARPPMLTMDEPMAADASAPAPAAPVSSGNVTAAGRKSSPMLTGY